MMKSIPKPFGQSRETVAAPVFDKTDKHVIRLALHKHPTPKDLQYIIHQIQTMNLPYIEKFLLTMLFRNGLRVSEICDPQSFTLIDNARFAIWSSKQEKFKICHLYEYENDVNVSKYIETIRFWQRSRQHYYRVLYNIVPYVPSNRKKNQTITHSGRNMLAQAVYSNTSSIAAVMQALGVLRESTAVIYLSPEQVKDLIKSNSNQ